MRAGFGKIGITPELGVELAGFGYYLERRALSVNDPLYARVTALEQDGTVRLIVSCDLLGLSAGVCREVFRHAEKCGCDAGNVMIVSVHTHCGPAVKYHEGCGYTDENYVKGLPGLICAAVDMALGDMQPVTALMGSMGGYEGDCIYNRADPDGPVDKAVRGFMIERGVAPAIALVSAACHGVFRGRSTAVSADFSGEVCSILDEKGMHGMYVNGLCGDIDPFRPDAARLREYARDVAGVFLDKQVTLPIAISGGSCGFELRLVPVTADEICNAAAQAVERAGGAENPQARVALIWKQEMLEKLPSLTGSEEISVKYIILGGVPVMALPFEGFTRIGMDIRAICGRSDALILGCAEELLGYLPTMDDIGRGSYAALESTFLYKRLPVVPGEAERLGSVLGHALKNALDNEN